MAIDLTKIARDHAARQSQKTSTSSRRKSKARLLDEDGKIDLTGIALAHKKGLRLYEDEEYASNTPESRLDMDYVNGMSSWVQDTGRRLSSLYASANRETTPWGQANQLASRTDNVDELLQAAYDYADYIQNNEGDLSSVLGRGTLNQLEQGINDTIANLMRYNRQASEANRGSLGAVNRYLATEEGQAQIQPYLDAQEEAQRRQEEQAQESGRPVSSAALDAARQAIQVERQDVSRALQSDFGTDEYNAAFDRLQQIDQDVGRLNTAIDEARDRENMQRWSSVMQNPDFAEYSRRGAEIENDSMPTGFFEPIARAFQGGTNIGNVVTYARDPANASAIRGQNETPWGTASRNVIGGNQTMYDNPLTLYWFMTDDEVSVYNYLLAKDNENGTSDAQAYLNDLTQELNTRRGQANLQDVAMWAQGNPVLASASSVLSSPVNGLAYAEGAINRLRGQPTDSYSPTQLQTRGANIARGTVAEDIQENVAESTGQQWLGDVASFVYQTGMSVADSLLNTAIGAGLFGGGTAGSVASSLLMSGGAASSAYQDAVDRGASENTALAAGGLAGFFEAFFERFSIDEFLSTASMASKSGMVKTVLRQMGVEASEEAATEVANILSDRAIMGDLSNFETSVAAYMAQGMSEEDARRKAVGDLGLQVLEAAAGGALSGGMTSGVSTTVSAARSRSMANSAIQNNAVDALIDAGLQLDENSAAYAVAQQLRNSDLDPTSTGAVARLVRGLAQDGALTSDLVQRIGETQEQESNTTQETSADTASVQAVEADPLMQAATAVVDEQEQARTARTETLSEAVRQETPSQTAQTAPESVPVDGGTNTQAQPENGREAVLRRARQATASTAAPSSARLAAQNTQTHEDVTVSGFDDVFPDGSATLRTEDGSIVALGDVQFSDPLQQQLYESAVETGNVNAARTFVGYYDSSDGGNIDSYAHGFYAIYNRALEGASFEQAVSGSVASDALTPVQQRAAYMAGQNVLNAAQGTQDTVQTVLTQEESRRDERKPQPREARAQKSRAPKPKNVPGLARAYTESNLNAAQRRAVKENAEAFGLIDRMAKIAGAQVVVVPSLNGMELNGRTVESDANGMYDPRSGRIYIGLDAQEGALSYVTMHELVHYVKAGNETGYSVLEKVVFDALRDSGEDVDALVAYQRERFGYSEAAAREEVVCNSVPAVLSDAQYVEQLMQEDASVARRIRRFAKFVMDRLRKQLGALSEGSRSWEQMGALAKDMDTLRRIEEAFDTAAREWRGGTTANPGVRKNHQDDDAKFSMKDTVERKGTLLAIHNLTGEKLRKFLALGGAPMPSIAVTRSDIEHSNFGDISLVFDKSTIDPKANRRNTVYSADAWTPTFPAIEYEVNPRAEQRISRRIRELSRKVDPLFQDELRGIQYGLEDSLNRRGGEEGLVRAAMENYGLKAAYLEEQGQHIAAATTRREVDQGFRADRADRYQAIADVLGTEDSEAIGSMKLSEVRDRYGDALEQVFPGVTKSAMRLSGVLRQTQAYLENRDAGPVYETVTDSAATRRAIDAALDQAGYEHWVRNLYDGIEGASGVRNGKDPFTPAGNRRSFAQTHYPVTLENLAKAMAAQNGGNTKNVSGFNGVKTLRAGMAQRFKSIAEMHKLEGRLRNLSQEEMDAISNALSDRMYDLMARIDQTRTSRGQSNDLMRMDYIGETLMEIADSGKYSAQNIREVFMDAGMPIDTDTAEEVRALLFDIQQMPVNLFEAKPERAVYTNEVRLAVLPDGKYPEIEERLTELGIPVTHYDENVAGDRLRVMNSEATESLRFSLRDTEPADVDRLRRQNERLAKALDNARRQVRIITGSRIDPERLQRIARRFVRQYKSKYSAEALANELRQIYTYVEAGGQNLDWTDVDSFGIGVARKVVENAVERDDSASSQFTDLRDYFQKTPLKLSAALREQIENSFGNVSAFRRELGNRVRFSDKGVELDVALGEIREMYPFLDYESMDIDTLVELTELTRPAYVNPFGDDLESAAADLWMQLQEAYVDAAIPETFAERKKAQIDQLKAEMQQMRKDNDLAARMAVGRARAEGRRALQEERAEWRRRMREQRASQTERAERRKYRERILASTRTLSDWLTAPNDKRFVPESLRTELASFLAAIDVGYREGSFVGGQWADRMARMLREVEKANKAAPENGTMEFDADTVASLEYITEQIARVPKGSELRDMSAQDLEVLSDVLQAIKHQIINADKIFVNGRRESIAQVGNDTIDRAVRRAGQRGNERRKKLLGNKFVVGNMKPVYFFRNLGGKLRVLGDDLFRGESEWAVHMRDERQWYADIKKRYHVDRWQNRKNDKLTFRTEMGDQISLTREQALAIYAIDRREKLETHTHHLNAGGIVFERDDNGKIIDNATAHPLSDADIQRINEWLTDEQKAYADELVHNMSTTLAEIGNRTSLRLVGYKKFTGEHYVPFHVSGSQLSNEPGRFDPEGGAQQRQSARQKNKGFTKSVTQGSNNPLVMENLTDMWARHVQDMSSYAAMAIPQDNLIRLYNYKRPNEAGRRQETVKSAMTTGYGRQTVQYLDRLNADIGGTMMIDPRDRLMSSMVAKFKKGAVLGSLSVAIQQPSAFLRAFAHIPWQYMRPGALPAYRQAQRYAGTAIIKDIGGYDLQGGQSAADWLLDNKPKKPLEWTDRILGKLPELADAMTWGAIWNSVKAEVAHKTNLKRGSEEFLRECGRRFDEVTRLTQVYDSTLSRSDYMRDRSTYAQMATAFMAESTTSMNLLFDAVLHANDRGMEGRVAVHTAALAFLSSTIVNAVLNSIVYAARDDEDELSFGEKYKQQLKSSLLGERISYLPGPVGDVVGFFAGSDFSPIGQVPILSDVASIVSGYDVSRTDMDVVSNVVNAFRNLWSESRTSYAKVRDLVGAVGNLIGVPVRNLWRDTEAILRTVGIPVPATSTNASTQKGSFQRAYQALLDGDRAGYQRYMDRAEALIRESIAKSEEENGTEYVDVETEVNNRLLRGIRDALKEDPRIAQMAEYRVTDWDYDEYTRLRNQLLNQGFPLEAITGAVNSAINDLEDTGEIESTPYSPEEWTQEDLQAAIEEAMTTGDTSEVEAIQQAMLTQTDTYWSVMPEDPVDYVRSAARKAYQAASNDPNDRQAIEVLELFGYTQEDAQGWENDAMRQEVYTSIDVGDYSAANAQIQSMKQNGMKPESIRDGIRTKYRKQIQDAQIAGDTQRVRELRSTLMNLNLYDANGSLYFSAARIDEWIRDAGKEE